MFGMLSFQFSTIGLSLGISDWGSLDELDDLDILRFRMISICLDGYGTLGRLMHDFLACGCDGCDGPWKFSEVGSKAKLKLSLQASFDSR